MERFWKWLEGDPERPRSVWEISKVVFYFLVFHYVWALIAVSSGLFEPIPNNPPPSFNVKILTFFNAVFYAPITEEFIFRLFPIMLGLLIIDIKILNGWLKQENLIRDRNAMFIVWGVVSSIIFGLAHGSVANILVQGIGGACMWIVFLYSSQLGKDLEAGYLSAVFLHGLYNFVVYIPFFLS